MPSGVLSLVAILVLVALPVPGSHADGFLTFDAMRGQAYNVSFDGRSLLLNDERTLFLSGAVHYPRVTPALWPLLAATAKSFGLNMIETYAFWSFHEPIAGELLWQGNANLSSFIEVLADAGLFVMLRIGPYVCAEYDNGGLPSVRACEPNNFFACFSHSSPLAFPIHFASRSGLGLFLACVSASATSRGWMPRGTGSAR